MRIVAILLAALCLAGPAWAGDLAVTLVTPGGRPVTNGVVMVKPQGFIARGPIRFAWPYRMAQKDMQFAPFVLVAPVGAEIAFPNLDPVRHHVYSFSPAKTFELKLYSRDETRTVRVDKPGVIALGCNIHDDMSAFIRVVDTPFALKSGADGGALLHGLPPGPATLTVWHPYLKQRGGEISRAIVVPASGVLNVSIPVELRAAPLRRGGY